MAQIQVRAGGREYPVLVGRNALERELSRHIADMGPRTVTIVSHPLIRELHGKKLSSALSAAREGRGASAWFLFPQGEENKSLGTLEQGYHMLLKSGMTREDLLLAFGGGVVGDLTGFLAATYMRGLRYLQVPTTLMAMVDSAIGGKVGVDLPGLKNAVGAFYQPWAVYADIALLETLPERELRSGIAEVTKYGFLYEEGILEEVEGWRKGVPARTGDLFSTVVKCAGHKARVVAADERDLSGERAMLNYGHTFGHAMESACGYGMLRHGEAVAMGMIMAARLSELIGLAGEGLCAYHARLLMPVLGESMRDVDLDRKRLVAAMQADKKKGESLRFVLLEGPQEPRLIEAVDEMLVETAVGDVLEMLKGEDKCL